MKDISMKTKLDKLNFGWYNDFKEAGTRQDKTRQDKKSKEKTKKDSVV